MRPSRDRIDVDARAEEQLLGSAERAALRAENERQREDLVRLERRNRELEDRIQKCREILR